MHRLLRPALVASAGLVLASFAPLPRFSAATLEALDPSRIAEQVCGERRAGSPLTHNLLFAAAVAAPASAGRTIPLYPDLTTSPFPVSTRDAQARRYFSQGLLLAYGFNHAGAVRSFREAQRRDPTCALCWWGEALALGPNINAPMDDRDRAAALDAMDRAMALRAKATPMERALIEAVARRYARDPKADRAALDAAYADAMLDVARRFPDDDVAVLAADAAMNTTPWNYWAADKKTSIGRAGDAVRLVEAVLARNPGHVQAGHLYIHLMEAADPVRAEAAADRMSGPSATPSAAHLVHMPGHIYQLRGRHADSIRVNVAAAHADEAFLRSAGDQGLVRYGYYPHNIHFIVTSAQMAGDMGTAVREARRLRTVLDPATSERIAWIQAIDAAPYLAMAQFAEPKAILALPAPDARLPYAAVMRHYARAVAYARLRDRAAFDEELSAMERLRASGALKGLIDQGMPAADLTALAELAARGRFAAALGRHDEAIGFYRQAAAIESRIPYQEPTYWYYPVKQSLGAALFQAGRYDEAGEAFRAVLMQTPNNGWALYGLSRSEAAQGRQLEAAAARKALSKAWLGDVRWLRMDRL